jgi:hypothetical protein
MRGPAPGSANLGGFLGYWAQQGAGLKRSPPVGLRDFDRPVVTVNPKPLHGLAVPIRRRSSLSTILSSVMVRFPQPSRLNAACPSWPLDRRESVGDSEYSIEWVDTAAPAVIADFIRQ